MSWTPADSITARTAPPAITPVPSRPGLSITAARAEATDDRVRDRRAPHRDPEQVALRAWSTPFEIADGTSRALPDTETDPTVAVADDDQRGEREVLAALDDLGHPVDVDHPLPELAKAPVDLLCHRPPPIPPATRT